MVGCYYFGRSRTFFDQYHQSLTFWSPDSHYFVVAKEEEEDKNTLAHVKY